MTWEDELFVEIREEGCLRPPDAGVPDGLEPFLEGDGVLRQPIIRRRHYLTKDMCHMNLARANRPGNLNGKANPASRAIDDPAKCFFGKGKEDVTPRWEPTGEDYARIGDENWQLRAFPNLYPWLLDHLNIVETPDHKASSDEMAAEEESRALDVAARYSKEQEAKGRYVVLFRNQGVSASQAHFHWQIGALSYIPVRVNQELERAQEFFEKHQANIFDAICDMERSKKDRWIGENDHFAVFAPFAPRTNHEIWLVAKNNVVSLSQTTESERQVWADVLCGCVASLFEISGNDDIFVIVHQLPHSFEEYRLHIEIFPVKPWAGAERGFGELVVEYPPERTASEIRERMKDVFKSS